MRGVMEYITLFIPPRIIAYIMQISMPFTMGLILRNDAPLFNSTAISSNTK